MPPVDNVNLVFFSAPPPTPLLTLVHKEVPLQNTGDQTYHKYDHVK